MGVRGGLWAVVLVLFSAGFAPADDCADRLDGRWEIVADTEQMKSMVKMMGNQIVTFDAEKKTIAAKIGDKDKPAKPYTIQSCTDKEIVFESEKEKGGMLSLRITFEAPDRISMIPASAEPGKSPPQVFKKLP